MDQDLVDTLCVVLRDVVALYKSEGPTLIVPFSLKKTGEPKVLFTLIWPKNWGAHALPAR